MLAQSAKKGATKSPCLILVEWGSRFRASRRSDNHCKRHEKRRGRQRAIGLEIQEAKSHHPSTAAVLAQWGTIVKHYRGTPARRTGGQQTNSPYL